MGFLAEVTPIFPKKAAKDLILGGFFIQKGILLPLLLEKLLPAKA